MDEVLALVDQKVLWKREDLGETELRALASLSEEEARDAIQGLRRVVLEKKIKPSGMRSKSAMLAREIKRVVEARGKEGQEPPAQAEAGDGATEAKVGEKEEEAQPPDSGGGGGMSRRQAKKKEEEEMAALMGGGGGGDGDDDALDEERDLRRLTGCPHPEDVLLFAVPVVAPYGALAGPHYRYKVKLTPGQGKKGKTAQQALEIFVREKEASPREVELIRAITDNELVAAMLGDTKLSKPGMQQALSQAKKSKKKAAAASKPLTSP